MPPRSPRAASASVERLLEPYNPWWGGQLFPPPPTPAFRRPVFDRIFEDIKHLKQIVSITGPRRVGKTTIVRQAIEQLLLEGMDPRRILYFSMDDPLLFREPYRERLFDMLVAFLGASARGHEESRYVFLDEIQRFEGWELYLKKYYDLGYPLRFVISGSATSPIFKKSRESLLGRVKDFHILPFSFREYVLFHRREDRVMQELLSAMARGGRALRDDLVSGGGGFSPEARLTPPLESLDRDLRDMLDAYMVDGGFPEVWELHDLVRKQEYLYDNQVQKVIFEDLVLTTEFRKPENIKAFYLSLIEEPGRELTLEKAASKIGVSRPMLEKYFPMLEMTDLVKRLPQFTKKAMKLRRGNVKCYLVDLALRNAVLKLGPRVLDDPVALGQYAENLVFNTLSRWPGTVHLSYFRDRGTETDFIVTLGAARYLAVEVKYRRSIGDLGGLHYFLDQYPDSLGLVVAQDFHPMKEERVMCIPLHVFLLCLGLE